MPFPYKTVLITGATSGIGRALAERMVANGIFVIAVGRRRDRLDELAAKHGPEKVAVEAHDVADLDGLGVWAKDITAKYPSLDCIVLNAGVQNTTDFTRVLDASSSGSDNAAAALAATVTAETTLNYLSPVHSVAHFLPHLAQHATGTGSPAAVILISSGLAIVPMFRCANYCATKAALHSFAWTLRSQLYHHHQQRSASNTSGNGRNGKIRVVEIIPPAVRTELHSRQPDLVAAGLGDFGMDLDDFTNEAWAGLVADDERDEIIVGPTREQLHAVEGPKRAGFQHFENVMRQSSNKA